MTQYAAKDTWIELTAFMGFVVVVYIFEPEIQAYLEELL